MTQPEYTEVPAAEVPAAVFSEASDTTEPAVEATEESATE